MSHYQILIHELEQHGRVTYRELMERYGERGYTYQSFVVAAKKLRDRGLASGPDSNGGAIVRSDVCPCCGRPL